MTRSLLPHIDSMPLAVLPAPFNHRDWLFEPKLDGFRAVAYIDNGTARLVSRKGNVYKVIPEAHGRAGSGAAGE